MFTVAQGARFPYLGEALLWLVTTPAAVSPNTFLDGHESMRFGHRRSDALVVPAIIMRQTPCPIVPGSIRVGGGSSPPPHPDHLPRNKDYCRMAFQSQRGLVVLETAASLVFLIVFVFGWSEHETDSVVGSALSPICNEK